MEKRTKRGGLGHIFLGNDGPGTNLMGLGL